MRRTVVALVLALTCASCIGGSNALVVGAVYPTTGPQASGGTAEYHGALLASDYVNTHGGVHGRSVKIDLRSEPSAEGVPGAVRALSKTSPVVIGSFGSTLSVVAARVAAQRNAVFWETGAVGDMPGKLPRSDRFFRVAPTGEELGGAAVAFVRDRILKTTGVRYGVAYVDDVYGQSVGNGAISQIEGSGATPVRYPYSQQGTDFDALARKITADHVNALVVAAYLDDGVALRRALVTQHVPLLVNIGTSSSYCMPEFGKALGADALGVFASDKPDGDILRTGSLQKGAVAALEWARTQYRRRFGAPMPAPALAGFAGAYALFHDVLPKAHGYTAASIASAARGVSLPQGSLPNGSGLEFGNNGNNDRALTVIWKWVGINRRAVVWPPAFATHGLAS